MQYVVHYRKSAEFRESGNSLFHHETDEIALYDAESIGEAATKFYREHDDESVYRIVYVVPYTEWLLYLHKNLDSVTNRASRLADEVIRIRERSITARRLQIASFVLSIVSLVLVLATIVIQRVT